MLEYEHALVHGEVGAMVSLLAPLIGVVFWRYFLVASCQLLCGPCVASTKCPGDNLLAILLCDALVSTQCNRLQPCFWLTLGHSMMVISSDPSYLFPCIVRVAFVSIASSNCFLVLVLLRCAPVVMTVAQLGAFQNDVVVLLWIP